MRTDGQKGVTKRVVSFRNFANAFKNVKLITRLGRLLGSRSLRPLECLASRHMKVARLLAQRTGRLYPPSRYTSYSFLVEAES